MVLISSSFFSISARPSVSSACASEFSSSSLAICFLLSMAAFSN
jgi:hypothetical protein